jgi:hypothetical protein
LAQKADAAEQERSVKALQPKPKLDAGATKSAMASKNRTPHAKAHVNRVKASGNTRIRGHVSAAGKRSQARRDSK